MPKKPGLKSWQHVNFLVYFASFWNFLMVILAFCQFLNIVWKRLGNTLKPAKNQHSSQNTDFHLLLHSTEQLFLSIIHDTTINSVIEGHLLVCAGSGTSAIDGKSAPPSAIAAPERSSAGAASGSSSTATWKYLKKKKH